MAVNRSVNPVQASIPLPKGVKTVAVARVLGEDRAVSVDIPANRITDRFDAYGVHVYEIATK